MSEKKRVDKLRSFINGCDKTIERLTDKKLTIQQRWTREYHRYQKKVLEFMDLKKHGTIKEQKLKESIKGWDKRSIEITKGKYAAIGEIDKIKEEKQTYEIELAEIMATIKARDEKNTRMVEHVFDLNSAVIEALELRNLFLTENVYDRLFDEKGNLRSQITIDNADSTKRVIARVNTITKIEPELAEKALGKIECFFDRVRPSAEMDKATLALFELTKRILVEKTKFDVGPDFYRFISVDFDSETFPELKFAQDLLRKSLRSEKTNSYIRLYERESRKDKWRPIAQTL